MGLFRFLFGPRITDYDRGKEDAERFLSTNPDKRELELHVHFHAQSCDEYDRGYLHVLMDSAHE